VGLFVALIDRLGLLQINRILSYIGNQGREAIADLYGTDRLGSAPEALVDLPESQNQILVYNGGPQAVESFDVPALVNLARECGGIVKVKVAVGDTVGEMTPVLSVCGSRSRIDEQRFRDTIKLGDEQTFHQDPKYAIRILVDIAIRALSPAINDPTTAVQSLDQIEDLLLRLGLKQLGTGTSRDANGVLRVITRMPLWEDFLLLAFDEILFFGSKSVQVMRRLRAIVTDLQEALPTERRPALEHWASRIESTVARSFADAEEKLNASVEDRQGLSVPRPKTSRRVETAQ
jgi:uncharacterized membrane protein